MSSPGSSARRKSGVRPGDNPTLRIRSWIDGCCRGGLCFAARRSLSCRAGMCALVAEEEVLMDAKLLLSVFGTVFLAELGDKTQLATMLFASRSESLLTVFVAASLALVATSAIGVLAGDAISTVTNPK